MAITRLGGANAISGTIPQSNIANASLGAVTALPAAISTGKVLQVVETRKTDTASTSSSTMAAISGLSASITPSSSSNKILVIYIASCSSNNHTHTAISRDSGSSFIGAGVAVGSRPAVSTFHYADSNTCRPVTCTILDTPSTTSAITYQVYWRANASTGYINRTYTDADAGYGARGASSITLMEIAG
jgi:type IV pilus biogenesis protein CpaD/CtpE